MRPLPPFVARLGAALAGALLLAGAANALAMARLHMAIAGTICGTATSTAHCGWCFAAVSLGLAATVALTFAAAPAVTARSLPC